MIPLCAVIPSRTRPAAVLGIAALQAGVFLAVWPGLGGEPAPAVSLGLAPATWTWIGLAGALIIQPDASLLIANGLALWLFGGTVEDRLGHGRFAALWLISGLAGALAQTATVPSSAAPLLGATSAVAGVIGATFALYPRSRFLVASPVVVGVELVDLPAWMYACVWALVLLVTTTTMPPAGLGAAVSAGLSAGVLCALVLRRPERMAVEWWDGAR